MEDRKTGVSPQPNPLAPGARAGAKTTPLFTSIPPRFVRKDKAGVDFGRDYFSRCVASWRTCNLEPVSINSRAEEESQLTREFGIRRVEVERNALDLCGKPLVYITDFIRAACSDGEGPLVIANSDILLDIPPETSERIAAIQPGECLVASRVDIRSMDVYDGSEYRSGYDFFAYHTYDLRGVADSPFIFGLPWWDHFLPIAMFLQGARPVGPSKGIAYHLEHTERWDWQNFIRLGHRYISLMRELDDDGAGTLVQNINAAVSGLNDNPLRVLLRGPRNRARALTAKGRERNELDVLDRVAQVNARWINNLIDRS